MKQIVLVTGASSGFGLLSAQRLAQAGHTVYASMRETQGRNAPRVTEIAAYAQTHGVDLRTVELDVQSQASVQAGIDKVVADNGRLDVIVHNAGIWCSVPPKPLPRNSTRNFTTSMCCRPSA